MDMMLKEHENEFKRIAKKELNLNDTMSDCGMSNFSNQSGYPQQRILSTPQDKYKAERTSLLHGNIQYNKYPEANIEMEEIDRELNEDQDLQIFREIHGGIRQRSKAEIELAKRLNDNDVSKLMDEQTNLFKGLEQLNDEIKVHNKEISKKHEETKLSNRPSLTFTDLKLQKEQERKREALKK